MMPYRVQLRDDGTRTPGGVPGFPSRAAFVALALVLSALPTACLQAVSVNPAPAVSTEWRRTLYALEMFEYEPVDAGSTLFIPKGDHVPNGGMLVAVTKDRYVRAIEAASGRDIWKIRTGAVNVARPLELGEDIVVASMDGHLYRLHARNGRTIFKSEFPLGEGMTASPALVGKALVATSIGNRIAAFDRDTGALLWDKKRPHVGEFTISGQAGAMALSDTQVVTGFSDGRLVAYGVEDGATLWSTDLREGKNQFVDIDTTPQLLKQGPKGRPMIVAGAYAVGLFGLDAATGDVEWLVRGEGFVRPAAADGMLYTTQPSGWVSAIDSQRGAIVWKRKVDIGIPTGVAATRKYLLVPNGEGMVLMRRETGRPVTMIRDSRGFSAIPEYAYGTLYTISNSGVYYALNLY